MVESINYFDGDWVWDIETYPNVITFAFMKADKSEKKLFEISNHKNDMLGFLDFCRESKRNDYRWVGFNSLGFDYPVVHWVLEQAKKSKDKKTKLSLTPSAIYKYAMKVIESKKDGSFGISVKSEDILIRQLDLFKMCHYDNKAKMTSLKLLEFNMRLDKIEDLPFPVGKPLSYEEILTLVEYNFNDVYATHKFYELCHDAIKFRQELSLKYNFDCTNLNDSKIGEQFFVRKIEAETPNAFYETSYDGRKKMKQTKRDCIVLKDCIFDYVAFARPEFKSLKKWFQSKVITETKGALSDIEEHLLGDVAKYSEMVRKDVKFKDKPSDKDKVDFLKSHPKGWFEERELKAMEILRDDNGEPITEIVIDSKGKAKVKNVKVPKKSYYGCYNIAENLNVVIDGFRYDLGTGGIHGSICGVVKADDEYEIWDWDVASFYPNMAISNRIYPEHLNESFCDSYESFYKERSNYAKGTGENLAIKLGLNATYGNSNSQYSPFYDPKYTMSITIGGQLSLCMLMERLIDKCDVKLVQCNTDGFTIKIHKSKIEEMIDHVKRWEKVTGLVMEDSHYSSMYVADVNNYIAFYTDGKMKSKGRYEYKPQKGLELTHLHKNHSAMVIQMAVEYQVLGNGYAEEFIMNHKEPFDFMLRAKVPRSSRLVLTVNGEDLPQQNICRYYPALSGGELVKIMPPLDGKDEERRLSLESGWLVKVCNNMSDFDWDINYDYYIQEAKKLLEPFEKEVYV